MRIVSAIPATFVSPRMELFTVHLEEVDKPVDAPEWVRDTLLFKMREDINEFHGDVEEVPDEPAKEPEEKPKKKPTKKKGDA